jgi:hypothetical protein
VALKDAHVYAQTPCYRVLVFLGADPFTFLFTLVKALLFIILKTRELRQALAPLPAMYLGLISLLHFRYQVDKVYKTRSWKKSSE